MGCTQSKIENEEAVTRCKERKVFMKEAVSQRNAFAAAHSAYAISLKNTGAALSDYSHAEVSHHASLSSTSAAAAAAAAVAAATTSSVETLPPPPPLPNFSAPAPLQRAATMPEMKIPKPSESRPVAPTIMEDDENEIELPDNEKLIRKRSNSSSNRGGVQEKNRDVERGPQQPQPQPPPPQQQQWKEEVMRGPTVHQDQGSLWGDFIFAPVESMPGPSLAEPPPAMALEEEDLARNRVPKIAEEVEEVEPPPPSEVVVEDEKVGKAVEVPVPVPEKKVVKKGGEVGRRAGKSVNLMQIFAELDDHFLKSSESAHEVSKLLEATRLHYHSNFADNRGNGFMVFQQFAFVG